MAAVPDNGPVIVGVTWWLCFFSGAFLALRIYAKLSRRHELWWDDHILIVSWILLLAESIVTHMGQSLGFGKRTVDIPVENLSSIALYTSIGASISCFASTGSKISFGFTLLRLTNGPWRMFVWFAIVTLFVVMIPSALFTWVQCTPREKAWNTFVDGTCWNPSISTNYGIFNAAWCATIDFALALLPWKLIWHLQLLTREKVGVGIAMSMGILSGVCAIVKGIYVIQLRQQDFYYNGKDVTIWTAVETATAIIAASIPVLRVFFKEAVSSMHYNFTPKDVPLPSMNRPGATMNDGGLANIWLSQHKTNQTTPVASKKSHKSTNCWTSLQKFGFQKDMGTGSPVEKSLSLHLDGGQILEMSAEG
ncbi:hypothetical protein BS50DRAFT_599165 [Corynespora cassiicola Philippines]|uniref:Rhodopsin domain-containing protein n=1 Tax=Corynespora cassiicola Philippines TaxID=1448308 RepID=A0A2T2NT99_CORCC|nr:hypothetical protein BS50DRAFT_599165 [Corynespora cassiicola Philippines]